MTRACSLAVLVLSVSVAAAKDPLILAPSPNQPPQVRRDAQLTPASTAETSPTDLAAQRAVLQQKVAELGRRQRNCFSSIHVVHEATVSQRQSRDRQ